MSSLGQGTTFVECERATRVHWATYAWQSNTAVVTELLLKLRLLGLFLDLSTLLSVARGLELGTEHLAPVDIGRRRSEAKFTIVCQE
jgi:hypothetical protein